MGLISDIRLLVERPRIVPGTTTANWNGGLATSGQPGADLVTVGVANQWYRLNQFIVILTGFNALATVYTREYLDVGGVNRLILVDDYGPPPPVLAFMSWWFDAEFYGPYRVEVYSDQAADDGLAVDYEYRIKSW